MPKLKSGLNRKFFLKGKIKLIKEVLKKFTVVLKSVNKTYN